MSTESVSVAMETPAEAPSIEEQAAAVGLNPDGTKMDAPADPLLGKFSSVEDLAKAYGELEKKLSAGEPAPAPAPVEADADLSISKEEAPEATDMEKLLENGTITQDMFDTWKRGEDAAAESFNNAVFDAAGGQEAYNDMVSWAADNLSDAEIDTFNDLLNGGNVAAVKLAVAGLKAQMGGAREPERNIAGGEPASLDVFNSWAEVHEAMADPRYTKDHHFNRMVVEKLGRSKI